MPPRGLRTEIGTRTRTAILDAAIALLGRAGPEGITASAIAREAGVSKATLFHHFRTIDEIPLVALDRFWASSIAQRGSAASSLRGYLSGLGKQVMSLAAGRRRPYLHAHLAFLVKALFDARLERILASASGNMHQLTANEIARRLPARRAEDVEMTARMVEMILDGMMIGLAVQRGRKSRELSARAWRRFLDLLLRETADHQA